ncbi:MAG: tRNA (guanosine(46)-N7)-methyltransferase TrmB [Candidatus Amulumruptor caecigallinarius]|nr:tRNA (guanosine(46)-N7)-methyltransferase TrmB [Candidatus Amulumruptor caecigallinarius]MCM1396464.1 tRNA (guanosine(46)-N7)-methyltransferase TrmB [Candidatus Amulumruptor caecigallinarius]MCM1453479.1 tRNA (guanosine(46)-N7)-methyltransferase TrmB [bacterium]
MGKNKLKKFAEMETLPCVFQYPFARLEAEGFPLKGRWRSDYFHNDNPIVLELGCGKGEYTVGLARRFPGKNYIGLDIKGARMWTGAKAATEEGMTNVAFLRTNIELLERFFAPGEVDEIWITFADPQMKKTRARLTSTRFMGLYHRVLAPGGRIHLKTDSPFLYTYTRWMLDANDIVPTIDTADLYAPGGAPEGVPEGLLDIRTFYEQQWLSRGLPIKYLSFVMPPEAPANEPAEEPEHDTYRSFSRGVLECMQPDTTGDSTM